MSEYFHLKDIRLGNVVSMVVFPLVYTGIYRAIQFIIIYVSMALGNYMTHDVLPEFKALLIYELKPCNHPMMKVTLFQTSNHCQ